jgi:hypothetical protein
MALLLLFLVIVTLLLLILIPFAGFFTGEIDDLLIIDSIELALGLPIELLLLLKLFEFWFVLLLIGVIEIKDDDPKDILFVLFWAFGSENEGKDGNLNDEEGKLFSFKLLLLFKETLVELFAIVSETGVFDFDELLLLLLFKVFKFGTTLFCVSVGLIELLYG